MAFHLNERYQSNCKFCGKTQEGDSATEAILSVEGHERECVKNPHRVLIEKQIARPSFRLTASDAREIVRITPEGEVIVNPDFSTAEAAHAFWEAVKKLAAGGPQ